ncbi:phenylalanine 4-monooxygenase [Flavobacteriaceae bacterium UJ101]|nr:phenylalanine 4-monooxygenase [Flavobacteriaceae bacterium UJ101]
MSTFESNEILDKLPNHLKQFIIPQPYDEYTPQNQAVWRYIMKKNVDYLSKVAHNSYLDGLKQTGVSLEKIPTMYGMNRILKEIGWAAVSVDGFIPPAAFMEFQAYNVLVIAADIRTIDHIEYTPAPDIIHESAGHAPIIANPEYAEYLRRFGEIGCKAISSAQDYEIYEAIRHLSILKEDVSSDPKNVQLAEEKVIALQNSVTSLSEMSLIRNLHWWTVEYGLIGTLEDPKIYGAGLLSSIGESKWCMSDKVAKLPYTLDAAYQSFDITQPQPQLFVTPDFAHLSYVLESLANKMALRRGGLSGVQKLIESNALGTIELSTGLQISGVFTNVIAGEFNQTAYIQTTGKTALSYREKELIGHSTDYHSEGFGSPIGKLKGINIAIEDMSPTDLEMYGIYEGKQTTLTFEGDIIVSGEVITGKRNLQGKIVLISFKNCTVKHGGTILFHPDWGIYDMAVGNKIVSAFSGPADVKSFDLIDHVPSEKTHKIQLGNKEQQLNELYFKTKQLRDSKSIEGLETIFNELVQNFPDEWLLPLEILELAISYSLPWVDKIEAHINQVKTHNPDKAHLVDDGIELLSITSSF